MRYLITTKINIKPFFTSWFIPENHFDEEIGMVVYDLKECKYTTDGYNWHEIEIDQL